MRNPETHARARTNRRELTSAEAKLWAILRGRRYRGVKFRRQHAIGPYGVDFACVATRLVLEVDGGSHEGEEQRAFDAARTAFLEKAGWRVRRLKNADVFEAGDGLYDFLDEALGLGLP
jgi:very-short-patch-repair endonuclease